MDRMTDPHPFQGDCARCEDTGFTHTTQPSPISGLPTEYAIPCRCTIHGKPREAMINRRFRNRDGSNVLTSNDIYQGPLDKDGKPVDASGKRF